MTDPVNNPKHYNSNASGVECIELVELMPFCEGNAIKYCWRSGLKGPAIEDLKKARWYLLRAESSAFAMPSRDPVDPRIWDILERIDGDFANRAQRSAIVNIATGDLTAALQSINVLIAEASQEAAA